MKEILLVGAGGCIGAICRYKLGGWILHHWEHAHFPLATLLINLLGCLLIGVIGGVAERAHAFSPHLRILLITGLLGGFTTFSAFGFETIYLLRRGDVPAAALYVGLSILLGVVAVWAGLKIAFACTTH
jgi:CrcB protein